MLIAKRAITWILGKLKLLQSDIDLLKIGHIWSISMLCNYFHIFTHGYSTLVALLTSLTQSKIKFILTEDCEHAFKNVNFAWTHAPILTLPELRESFEVISDASLIEARAIMLQGGRPIAFEDNLSLPERNYINKVK